MMPENPYKDVTVVCVTYQSRRLVETLSDTLRPYPNIVVIDNASTDGTVPALRARLPRATFIENLGNDGFGKACNAAMTRVRTPLVLLLNPDCEIEPGAVDALLEALRRYPGAGIVAPQSLDRSRKPRKSFRPAFHARMKKAAYRVPDATCSARWLHGCCLLLRTHAFRLVGGFDERFFLFFEDDDLCLRMHEAGHSCLLEPSATVVHAGGASSGPGFRNQFHRCFHYVRSKHLITRKYLGKGEARSYLLKIACASLPAALVYAVLLQRRHCVKWLAWGTAAIACTFGQPALPRGRGSSTGTPRHLTR